MMIPVGISGLETVKATDWRGSDGDLVNGKKAEDPKSILLEEENEMWSVI